MKGEIIRVGENEFGNSKFVIRKGPCDFPVETEEVLLRDLIPGDESNQGDEVDFMTDRETGHAIIINPPKPRGIMDIE